MSLRNTLECYFGGGYPYDDEDVQLHNKMLAMSDETFADGVIRTVEELKSENRKLKEQLEEIN